MDGAERRPFKQPTGYATFEVAAFDFAAIFLLFKYAARRFRF
jgi:hypothetical protein